MKTQGAIAAIVALLLVLAWLAFWKGEDPSGDVRPPTRIQPTNAAARHETESATPDAPERQQLPVEAAADPTTGSLRVRVKLAESGDPVADIPIFLRSRAHREGVGPKRTDEAGQVRFDGLAPGRWRVATRRGSDVEKAVLVEVGKTHDVELALPVGVTVTGVVVDAAGEPIAGARVVVTGWGGSAAETLAHTDDRGRFELRALAPTCSVGARAPGYAPSLLQGVTGGKVGRVQLRIVLHAGGALACTVLAPDGKALAGAIVRAGIEGRQHQPEKLADGSYGSLIPQQQRTDSQGHARFDGVASGEVAVAAAFRGYSPWTGRVRVLAGKTAELTIRLHPPASLVGTVRDAMGRPHADVWVLAGRHGELAHRTSRTDKAGDYRITGTPIGEFRAEVQGNGLRKVTKITARPGQTVRWDPEIAAGRDIPGRLLGPDGQAIAKAMIEGYSKGAWLHTVTDRAGRFTLKNVVLGNVLRLTTRSGMQFFPVPVFDDLPPASGELLLRLGAEQLASVRIKGRLVDPAGKPVTHAHLSPQRRGHGNTTVLKTQGDGTFEFGPYPPGEYRLLVDAKGWAKVRTPWRHLKPKDVADLGDVRLTRPGTLVVEVYGAVVTDKLMFAIRDARGAYTDRIGVVKGRGQLGGLEAGEYRLQVRGKGVLAEIVRFVIRSSEETRVLLPGASGQLVSFSVTATGKLPRRVDLRVLDARGKSVIDVAAGFVRENGTLYGEYELAPGEYRARTAAGELQGEVTFTVATKSIAVAVPMR